MRLTRQGKRHRFSGEGEAQNGNSGIERILAVLRRHRLKLTLIAITHAHIDHIGGAKKLKQATGAPVYLHEADLWLARALPQQAQMIGLPGLGEADVQVFDAPDALLREGDQIRVGTAAGSVLHSPGHTEGSVCLYFPDAGGSKKLFAGDTLFQGSIGRTDLPGGDSDQILRSLQNKLLALDDDTEVVPGHGPLTTIGRERAQNPFLQGL